jgi:hypothetical protein
VTMSNHLDDVYGQMGAKGSPGRASPSWASPIMASPRTV